MGKGGKEGGREGGREGGKGGAVMIRVAFIKLLNSDLPTRSVVDIPAVRWYSLQ